MIDFIKAKHYTKPYNYFELENVFDEKPLDRLLKEFPNVSETISVMGGEKKNGSKRK